MNGSFGTPVKRLVGGKYSGRPNGGLRRPEGRGSCGEYGW